ncbi:MAG TPA: TPM domain-containing protein [Nitrospira sp.]|nr:TPM domain-containing protein [Nitrospira sp.]
MAIGKDSRLSGEDRLRISEAVRSAERRTKAEIVPMVVSRSGLYRDAQHRAGLIMALLALASLLLLETAWMEWGWHASNAGWLLLAALGAYAMGAQLGTWTPVIRLVTSTERMRQKVRLRAERAFAVHGISQTRERTGVLLMLSMLERQVYVLPDKDLAQHVQIGEWNEVVNAMIGQLRAGDVAGALCAGIERCGTLLARACPAGHDHNPNELSDAVIEEP